MIKMFRAGAALAAILTAGLIGISTPSIAADYSHRWSGSSERHADNGWRGNWGRDHGGRSGHDGRWDRGGWRGHDGWRDHRFGWRDNHDGRARFGAWRHGRGYGWQHNGRGYRGW